ncbi:MAG: 4Fe-4S binding protein [Clostridia bacterium]|nr:4Fe-4S binding protein [Clostridia bacterium]
MAKIAVLERKCTGCGLCQTVCPFGAIDMENGRPQMNAACRVCGICVKNCPAQAIVKLETRAADVDKSQWKDILVYAEASGGRLHPVGLELIGKARELAAPLGFKVKAVLVGQGVDPCTEELRHYGVSEIAVYDDPQLGYFRADAYAACVEDYIRHAKPSVVRWMRYRYRSFREVR